MEDSLARHFALVPVYAVIGEENDQLVFITMEILKCKACGMEYVKPTIRLPKFPIWAYCRKECYEAFKKRPYEFGLWWRTIDTKLK